MTIATVIIAVAGPVRSLGIPANGVKPDNREGNRGKKEGGVTVQIERRAQRTSQSALSHCLSKSCQKYGDLVAEA